MVGPESPARIRFAGRALQQTALYTGATVWSKGPDPPAGGTACPVTLILILVFGSRAAILRWLRLGAMVKAPPPGPQRRDWPNDPPPSMSMSVYVYLD